MCKDEKKNKKKFQLTTMEITKLKDYIFDENYQKIIFNFLDTQTKLRVKQVSKVNCNDVEFNNKNIQLCMDFISRNNFVLFDIELKYDDDDYLVNYIMYYENHNKLLELFIAISGWKYKGNFIALSDLNLNTNITNANAIGYVLYTDYIHLFQISGIILLVAMIGAITLTFSKRENVKRQDYFKQIEREKSTSISLKEVESNKGVNLDE